MPDLNSWRLTYSAALKRDGVPYDESGGWRLARCVASAYLARFVACTFGKVRGLYTFGKVRGLHIWQGAWPLHIRQGAWPLHIRQNCSPPMILIACNRCVADTVGQKAKVFATRVFECAQEVRSPHVMVELCATHVYKCVHARILHACA